MKLLVLAAPVVLFACEPGPAAAGDTDVAPASLIDNDIWRAATGDADPFGFRQGDAASCPDTTYSTESFPDGLWWTVETKTCAYATFQAPLQADLPLGARVTLRVWHYAITVGEGDFTITLAVGRDSGGYDTLFETTRPVPSSSGLIYDEFASTFAADKGDPLYFHVSNHGDNSWSLIELSVAP